MIKRKCARSECSVVFEVKKPSDKKKYCGSSCSAKVNNRVYPKRSATLQCKVNSCNKIILSGRSFCDDHKLTGKSECKIDEWISGTWPGGSVRSLSKTVRNYLLKKVDYKCERCGFNTPHPDDGKSILEIDHINGDGEDHRPENLVVLCPNCHALTSTYRARNKGKGRKHYYLRVSK